MGLLAAAFLMAMGSAVAEPAPDQPLARLKGKAEACISENAALMEKSESNLSEATSFLVDDLCAEQINAVERYQANTAFLSEMRSKYSAESYDAAASPAVDVAAEKPAVRQAFRAEFDRRKARYASAKIDPDSGRLVHAATPAAGVVGPAMVDEEEASSGSGGYPASREFRAFAARALLDARQSRLAH